MSFLNINIQPSLGFRTFRNNNPTAYASVDVPNPHYKETPFVPRAVQVNKGRKGGKNGDLDSTLEERYHALKNKHISDISNLHYQQFTIIDENGKLKTISAWVDLSN